jgi:hypothetical protein
MKRALRGLVFLGFLFLIVPDPLCSGVIRGVYGVPPVRDLHPSQHLSRLKRAQVNAVFVPPDRETIRWYRGQGFEVYLAVNAFGGRGAWTRFPDSRPVRADGGLLGSERDYKGHGGVCPTHEGWRRERLKRIRDLKEHLPGIHGIWLDFIRYPGLWESKDPHIPDTCYCERCLEKFGKACHVNLPPGLNTREAALWIQAHCPYEWMQWKKEQISSFVMAVKQILGPLKLGLFLVPWTKGERHNAISYLLAQDAPRLSRVADVVSPMLYHGMCGEPPSWAGYITGYYREGIGCELWPIVQSVGSSEKEFCQVLRYTAQAGAQGVLIFSWKGMREDLWDCVSQFQPAVNLIPNPGFHVPEGGTSPAGWRTPKPEPAGHSPSTFLVGASDELKTRGGQPGPDRPSRCIGITAGRDRLGEWSCSLPDAEQGKEYLFTCGLYREGWENRVYPSLSIWGQEFSVNQHWLTRTFQPIRLYITCAEGCSDRVFRFMNHHPGKTFWLTRPSLTRHYPFPRGDRRRKGGRFFPDPLFPIGVYGGGLQDLAQIRDLGINTVVIGARDEALREMIRACNCLDLRYILSVPRDPDRVHTFLREIGDAAAQRALAFYVNDEPGIHSFPVHRANDINRLIKEGLPGSATCMAVVRPQVCRDYLEASDFFMMDQYPVPSMPMTWLSDSMDQAREHVGSDRLASVIQAFGGRKWAPYGWPRMPEWQEMDCLAFLSIVHGSRGVFFFTFREVGSTQEGRQRLGRVLERLNRLKAWLLEENLDKAVAVDMVSPNRVDPRGRPSVHACLKRKGGEVLLIAVNTIGTHVEAVMRCGDLGARELREVFSGTGYPYRQGGLRAAFHPYEAKAFVCSEAGP